MTYKSLRFTSLLLLVLVSIGLARPGILAQGPALTLDELLFRASETLIAYQKELTGVVAQEQYKQQSFRDGSEPRTRTLTSDLVIVRPADGDGWQMFRDVFEVDGKEVRPHDGRLPTAFEASRTQGFRDARKIELESSKHFVDNLLDAQRPGGGALLPLVFLHPIHQYRCYFQKDGEEQVGDVSAWVVRYSEHARPTFLNQGRGDVFARGRLWLDPVTGRVLKSELFLGDQNAPAVIKITTLFREQPTLGLWLPSEVSETYEFPKGLKHERMEGTATYTNFRKLGTQAS